MKEEKIQTGLRIPHEQYIKIKNNSERAGISINQYTLMLIDIAFTLLEKNQEE